MWLSLYAKRQEKGKIFYLRANKELLSITKNNNNHTLYKPDSLKKQVKWE